MKKLPFILIFGSIALLMISIVISDCIYNKALELNGFYGFDKVTVDVKSKALNDMFTLSNVERLGKELKTDEMVYSTSVDSSVVYKNRYYNTRITGVNSNFINFAALNIMHGSFFTSKDDDECGDVALIDAGLAWDIFNTDDVAGQTIEIYSRPFKIVGVYKKYGLLDDNKSESIIEKLTDDGISNIYIPIDTLLDIDRGLAINRVQIHLKGNSALGENKDKVNTALQMIGKIPDHYEVKDLNIEGTLMRQKPRLVIYAIGVLIILTVLIFIKNECQKTYLRIKENLSNDYLIKAIRNNWIQLLVSTVKILFCILFILVIFKAVKFDIYISPEYVPEELIDTKYFSDLFESKIHEFNQNINLVRSQTEIEMNNANKLTNLLFFLGFFIGIPLFCLGIHLSMNKHEPLERVLCFSGICIVTTLLLLFPITSKLGLEYTVGIKNPGFIWMFVTSSVLFVYKVNSKHI